MNQDERYQQQYDDILDVVMKNALISNADSCFDDIPTEEEIMQSHSFSPEFLRNMEVLLHENQMPKRKMRHPARIKTGKGIEEPDQSFWEEWKQQQQTAKGTFAAGRSHKLRPAAKTAIAAAAVLAVVIGGMHLSDNGFLRASRTQNVVEDGQSKLLTDMMDGDYELVFRKPGFVPREYEIASDYTTDQMRILEYSNGAQTLTIKYYKLSNTNFFLDNERHPQEEKSIRLNQKYDAVLTRSGSSNAYTSLTWQDGLIRYRILGYESEEVLQKIAESMAY